MRFPDQVLGQSERESRDGIQTQAKKISTDQEILFKILVKNMMIPYKLQ